MVGVGDFGFGFGLDFRSQYKPQPLTPPPRTLRRRGRQGAPARGAAAGGRRVPGGASATKPRPRPRTRTIGVQADRRRALSTARGGEQPAQHLHRSPEAPADHRHGHGREIGRVRTEPPARRHNRRHGPQASDCVLRIEYCLSAVSPALHSRSHHAFDIAFVSSLHASPAVFSSSTPRSARRVSAFVSSAAAIRNPQSASKGSRV